MQTVSEEKLRELALHLHRPLSLYAPDTAGKIDDYMVEFADRRHRVAPLLYRAVQLDPDRNTEENVQKTLSTIYENNARGQLKQKAVAQKLKNFLANNGVPCLFVKGFHIGEQIYDQPELRQAKDIDAVIAPEDSARAISLLSFEGYHYFGGPNSSRPQRDLWKMRVHKDISFVDPQYGQIIELHQRLLYLEPRGFTDNVLKFANDVETLPISHSPYVLYLILHGALSYWPRLKWLADLSLLVRKVSAEQKREIWALAKLYDCQQGVIASLYFVEDIFPGSVDEEWQLMLERDAEPKKVEKLLNKFRGGLLGHVRGNPMRAKSTPRFPVPAGVIFENRIGKGEIILRRLSGALTRRKVRY